MYTAISRLLDYPDQELMDNLEDIGLLVKNEPALSDQDCSEIIKVIDWMAAQKLLELQEKYVATFDHGQETSLHLTHHLFGNRQSAQSRIKNANRFSRNPMIHHLSNSVRWHTRFFADMP